MELAKNDILILRAIASLELPTRRAVAEATGFSIVLVSAVLKGLEDRGLLARSSLVREGGGRPLHLYALQAGIAAAKGVSLSPNSLRVVTIDASGGVSGSESVPLALGGDPEEHVGQIVSQVGDIAHCGAETPRCGDHPRQPNGAPPLPPVALGVALPGMTDAARGVWVQGLQVSGISQVNIRSMLEQRTGVRVFVDDPARAVAFHEQKRGSGRGVPSFLVIYLGYGVGAGVVIDAEIYRGFSGLAGEIGHLVVDPGGSRCSCGDVGCLETVASTSGILRMVRGRLDEGVISVLAQARDSLTLEAVLAAARDGDRLAASTLHEVGERLGSACATAIKLFNPQNIIISGPGAMYREFFEPRIRMQLQRHIMPELLEAFSLHFAGYTDEVEARGMAMVAFEGFWDSVAREATASPARKLDVPVVSPTAPQSPAVTPGPNPGGVAGGRRARRGGH